MHSYKVILIVVLLCNLELCNAQNKFPQAKDLNKFENTVFVPTLENKLQQGKNSIYCSTFLLAWDEMRKALKSPILTDSIESDLYLLNKSESFKSTLKKEEYTSSYQIHGQSIFLKASLQKILSFRESFPVNNYELDFGGKKVSSFGTIGFNPIADMLIQIVYYESDNDFIIKVLPENQDHEIILYMTQKRYNSMKLIVANIEKKIAEAGEEKSQFVNNWKYNISAEDEVIIPKLLFNIETNFPSIERKSFSSNSLVFSISKAFQRTAFNLDERGAKVDSEATGEVVFSEPAVEVEGENPRPKKMRFDKTFFLMAKRVDSNNPYLGIWIENTELMLGIK
ncbi:MAG TPA: hypothetical protein DGG95_01740 [Cytophagales bacterium]|jgi:hypothetical protein|nr:hypothetical protein [Cytophagales bacterium]